MDAAVRSSNQFLATLSEGDFNLLHGSLRPFKMEIGALLVATGATMPHVFFPLSGIISLVVRLSEGQSTETAMIGHDGLFGGSTALNGDFAINDAVVQASGDAQVIDIGPFRRAAARSDTLRTAIVRYEQALLVQAQQSAACNASHLVEARLSRWLLRARDLSDSDTMNLTQEFLATMLGVQRSSVSAVASALQRQGLIRYRRGSIHIEDLDGLRKSSCECYAVVKLHYDKLRRIE